MAKGIRLHTIVGPFHAFNDAHAREILARVAVDAVRMGKANEQPWVVNEKGKPTRPLGRYADFLTPASLGDLDRAEVTPPMRAQNADLEGPLHAAQEFRFGALEELAARRPAQILDPVAKLLLTHELAQIAVATLRALGNCDHLAEEVERLHLRER